MRVRMSKLDHKTIYPLIAIGSLLFMQAHAADTGFWYDEFAQICYSGEGKTLLETIAILDPTPPLFSAAANLWMRIVPYGEHWLLLLPQIAVAASIVVLGNWIEASLGRAAGILSAFFLGTSNIILGQCGLEFRAYGFYLLTALLAFSVHDRYVAGGGRGPFLLFTAMLAGLMYVHIFGIGICAVMCFADLVLYRGRNPWKYLLMPYLCAAALFLPWIFCFAFYAGAPALASQQPWMATPTAWEAVKLFGYLCGNNPLIFLLFAAGVIRTPAELQRAKAEGGGGVARKKAFLILVSALSAAGIFVYGRLLRPEATLWVKRYFIGLVPCCVFIMASTVSLFFDREAPHSRWKRRGGIALAILCAATGVISLRQAAAGDLPTTAYRHREAAGILAGQEDCADDGTIVLSTLGDYAEGWKYYYLTLRGAPEGIRVASIYETAPEELRACQVVYVDNGFPGETASIQKVLDERYVLEEVWEDAALYKYRLNQR